MMLCGVCCTLIVLTPALLHAQTGNNVEPLPTAAGRTGSVNTSCSSYALQSAALLNLKQRGCYFARQLFSPQFAASTGFMTVMGQSMNSPFIRHERWSKFPHRFEIYYARHAAMDAGEYLAGYLHHEDPRLHRSSETGFWRRAGAALLSVVDSPDENGHWRPAYAPVAGSLSSAFTGTLLYRHSETLPTTMDKAGGTYAFYFVRAIFWEFKPDIVAMIRRTFHQ